VHAILADLFVGYTAAGVTGGAIIWALATAARPRGATTLRQRN
jgi:hypothetical protein